MNPGDDLDAWLDRQRLLDAIAGCCGTALQAAAALDRYRIVRDAAAEDDDEDANELRRPEVGLQ